MPVLKSGTGRQSNEPTVLVLWIVPDNRSVVRRVLVDLGRHEMNTFNSDEPANMERINKPPCKLTRSSTTIFNEIMVIIMFRTLFSVRNFEFHFGNLGQKKSS